MSEKETSVDDVERLHEQATEFLAALEEFIEEHADVVEAGNAREVEDGSDDPQAAFETGVLSLKLAISFPFLSEREREFIFSVAILAERISMFIGWNAAGFRIGGALTRLEADYLQRRNAPELAEITWRLTPLQRVLLYDHYLAVRFRADAD